MSQPSISHEQFQQYNDEQEAAKEALSQTVSEQMQACVQLRTQNAMLRKQIARLSPPQQPAKSESTSASADQTNFKSDDVTANDSAGNGTDTKQDIKSKKGKKAVN